MLGRMRKIRYRKELAIVPQTSGVCSLRRCPRGLRSEASVHSVPALELAGDLFDFYHVDENQRGLCVGTWSEGHSCGTAWGLYVGHQPSQEKRLLCDRRARLPQLPGADEEGSRDEAREHRPGLGPVAGHARPAVTRMDWQTALVSLTLPRVSDLDMCYFVCRTQGKPRSCALIPGSVGAGVPHGAREPVGASANRLMRRLVD